MKKPAIILLSAIFGLSMLTACGATDEVSGMERNREILNILQPQFDKTNAIIEELRVDVKTIREDMGEVKSAN
ncbi:MAG: hypothetical protein Q8O95_03760 [bacterium]|nr:hypothetical protein [bacterium]